MFQGNVFDYFVCSELGHPRPSVFTNMGVTSSKFTEIFRAVVFQKTFKHLPDR